MNEPIIRQVMASDGHTPEDVRSLFQTVHARHLAATTTDDDDREMTAPAAHLCEAAMRATKGCCLR
ncbi:hypothetical protein AAFN84_18140 [Mesorhizobium sp. CAU 1741]